jgi:hypothetical protein
MDVFRHAPFKSPFRVAMYLAEFLSRCHYSTLRLDSSFMRTVHIFSCFLQRREDDIFLSVGVDGQFEISQARHRLRQRALFFVSEALPGEPT